MSDQQAHLKKKRIAFAGGGVSGGHAASIVAVFQAIQSRADVVAVARELAYLWIGSKDGREREQARALGIPFVSIPVGKLRRYVSLENILDILRIPMGVIKSWFVLRRARPFVLFSSGGYVSVPPAIAAWILKIPVMIHENDVMAGLANRIVAHVARTIFVSSEESRAYFEKKVGQKKKVILTGIPLREDVLGGDPERAYTQFLFKSNLPTVLVIGGAQGAKALNDVVISAREELEKFCQVIHVCGDSHFSKLRAQVDDSGRYRLYPFLHHELKDAYAISQIVLTRGSAHVLNEVAYYGIPSIIVPIEAYSSAHQVENAKRIVAHQAGIMMSESQLSASELVSLLKKMLSDKQQLGIMSEYAKTLFIPDAAQRILDELLAVGKS